MVGSLRPVLPSVLFFIGCLPSKHALLSCQANDCLSGSTQPQARTAPPAPPPPWLARGCTSRPLGRPRSTGHAKRKRCHDTHGDESTTLDRAIQWASTVQPTALLALPVGHPPPIRRPTPTASSPPPPAPPRPAPSTPQAALRPGLPGPSAPRPAWPCPWPPGSPAARG